MINPIPLGIPRANAEFIPGIGGATRAFNMRPKGNGNSMAIEAARTRAEKSGTVAAELQFELREVSVGTALVLTDDLDTEITITPSMAILM
jgi:hypothetical protein